MMFYSPFYRYNYNRPYFQYGYSHHNPEGKYENAEQPQIQEEIKKEEARNSEDSPFIEIFGVSLYFDDILLVCLLLFLSQEGVEDQWLYIALVLLLFS